jgi:hypothetical protein
VAEREANGTFAGPADLNARVRHVTHTRLAEHFAVDFGSRPEASEASAGVLCAAPEDGASASTAVLRRSKEAPADKRLRRAVRDASDAGAPVAADLKRLSLREAGDFDVVFATFNCCRMSPRVDSFESKLTVLDRLVKDSPGLSVLLLQELFGNAAGLIARHLRASTGELSWTAAGCGSDSTNEVVKHSHPKSYGVSCNAVVYNARLVRLVAHTYVKMGANDDATPAFKRPPHVCAFESVRAPSDGRSRLLVVANLHVVWRDPRSELTRLGDLASAMRAGCVRALRQGKTLGLPRDDTVIVFAGDFNRAACENSPDFRSLHDAGYVELVSSNIEDCATSADSSSGELRFQFLREKTTVAGSKLDNIFIAKHVREALVDAWVYQVGGAGRKLGESGRASAGRLRSERSDHLPLVARLRLDSAVETDPWQCVEDFEVRVTSK